MIDFFVTLARVLIPICIIGGILLVLGYIWFLIGSVLEYRDISREENYCREKRRQLRTLLCGIAQIYGSYLFLVLVALGFIVFACACIAPPYGW